MKKSILLKSALCLLGALGLAAGIVSHTYAAPGTLYESPHVTFSPDGQAWTVKQALPDGMVDGLPAYWYPEGEVIYTGARSTLRELGVGEHYYPATRYGEIPVESWKVEWFPAQCIHTAATYTENYHGVAYGTSICENSYFSGWLPYCADCGEAISPYHHYLSREAAASIGSINIDLEYYYLCPTCNHLEQGRGTDGHTCRQISYNRYQVKYERNTYTMPLATGSTPDSFHMYNNAVMFEGEEVTPNTHLTLNGYQRTGYHFVGWNTEPDGTGIFYADGAEIYNLSTENYDYAAQSGIVTLYAQWKKIESNLVIDPNGGSYDGRTDCTRIRQEYGTAYTLRTAAIVPPEGYTVNFDTNGGSELPSQKSTYSFHRWNLQTPAVGVLMGDRYGFLGRPDDTDTIKACYFHHAITLPTPAKPNASFGGWYRDPEFREPVGYGGDRYEPAGDITLYAKWVELVLYAADNYTANGGKGAVDISWSQADGVNKTYKLYQSKDGVNFELLYNPEDATAMTQSIDGTYRYEESARTVTVPYSGFYSLTASGAQGGGFGEYEGGKGGSVTGKFYLRKGEVLTIVTGGQNGYNGGGTANRYGGGGGYSIISSDKKGTLLIGGGGGGATSEGSGGAGGSDTGQVTAGHAGGSGGAGGGGGFLGGAAGEYIVHHHTADCYRETSYDGLAGATLEHIYDSHVMLGDCADITGEETGNCSDGCHQYHLLKVGDSSHLISTEGNPQVDLQAVLWKQICRGGELWGESCLNVYDQNGTCIFSKTLKDILHTSYDLEREYIGKQQQYWHNNHRSYLFGDMKVNFVYNLPHKDDDDMPNGGYTEYWSYRYPDGTVRVMGKDKEEDGDPTDYLWDSFGDCPYPLWPDYNFTHCGDSGYHVENTPLFFVRANGCNESGILLNYTINLPEGTTGIYAEVKAMARPAVSHDVVFAMATEVYFHGGRRTVCGMTEGQILSSRPAYGGSNYVSSHALTRSTQSGVQAGDGECVLKALSVAYLEEMQLNGVKAPDLAAPDAVDGGTIGFTDAGENVVTVSWQEPSDNGTVYYHRAESYEAVTEQPLCCSNITRNELISGVTGYYCIVDKQPYTQIASNVGNRGSLLRDTEITVPISDCMQYLHIAAADVAGNVSPPTHVPLDAAGIKVAWRLYTDTLRISSSFRGTDYRNVYPAAADRTWYVRADGGTPFLLSFDSYMLGTARVDYQINRLQLNVQTENGAKVQGYTTGIPYTAPLSSTAALDSTRFTHRSIGAELLNSAMYTGASRSDHAKKVNYYQAFTLKPDLHGETITVTPIAGADFEGGIVYSEWERDSQNALKVIADAEAPVITGMDILSDPEVIDRGSRSVVLNLAASDALSGIREFYVEIFNRDNYGTRSCQADESNRIQLNITSEDPIFNGDFEITAHAVDNVGNEAQESNRVTEFALEATIERILAPHEPSFKRGESGILTVTTWGYADRVEVTFPNELSELNPEFDRTFIYSIPGYRQQEKIQFMIPLYAPEGEDYQVKVVAYKGDRNIERYPTFSTLKVNGTVLDEFRTRLR